MSILIRKSFLKVNKSFLLKKRYVHEVAVKGFGESNVDRYNSGRPSYSPEAIRQIGKIIQNNIEKNSINENDVKILELGAGNFESQ